MVGGEPRSLVNLPSQQENSTLVLCLPKPALSPGHPSRRVLNRGDGEMNTETFVFLTVTINLFLFFA